MRAHRTAVAVTSALLLLGSVGCKTAAGTTPPTGRNLRPVIAIFSQDTSTVTDSGAIDPEVKAELEAHDYMIPASYAKWIGQAGGRALPVLLNQPAAYYEEIFAVTNGLLFPGGNQDIDPGQIYTKEGELIWNLAKQANDRGDYYPLWGTCLGFEEFAVLETEDGTVISTDVVATNLALPLELTDQAARSRLFQSFSSQLVAALRQESITFNSHIHGLLLSEFESNPALNGFFDLLAVNRAPAGMVFVSTIEARSYPFYATQWHPEKNNWEWSQNASYSNIPHSPNAILASQATAAFFVNEARKSKHVFPEDQRDRLIDSATLLYTGKGDWTYEQTYVFCDPSSTGCGRLPESARGQGRASGPKARR